MKLSIRWNQPISLAFLFVVVRFDILSKCGWNPVSSVETSPQTQAKRKMLLFKMKLIVIVICLVNTFKCMPVDKTIWDSTEIDDLSALDLRKNAFNQTYESTTSSLLGKTNTTSSRISFPSDAEWIYPTQKHQQQTLTPAINSLVELIFAVNTRVYHGRCFLNLCVVVLVVYPFIVLEFAFRKHTFSN